MVYPTKKYVLLSKDEKGTMATAMLRAWVHIDRMVTCTDHHHHAVDHQALQTALEGLRLEMAYIQSALNRARQGGHYRGTLAADGTADIPPADDAAPF